MSNYEQDRGITRNSEQRHDQEIKRSSKIKRAGCDDQKCREEVATTFEDERYRVQIHASESGCTAGQPQFLPILRILRQEKGREERKA